jgi:hypothetical protein
LEQQKIEILYQLGTVITLKYQEFSDVLEVSGKFGGDVT